MGEINTQKISWWPVCTFQGSWCQSLEKKQSQKQQMRGGGWIGGMGLACAHCCMRNGWSTGTVCASRGTLPNILCWSILGKNLKENGYVHMYNWITLLYSRNYHNIVNELYFNKALRKWKGGGGNNSSRMELSWSTTWLSCLLLELVKCKGLKKRVQFPLESLLESLFLFPYWLQHLKSPKLSDPGGVCKENSTSSNWHQERLTLWS